MSKNSFINELKVELPDLSGFIEVKILERTAIVAGRVSTNHEDARSVIEALVAKNYPGVMFIYSVEIDNGLTVVADESVETTNADEESLDEVKVVYMGELPVNAITPNSQFKLINNEYLTNIDNCVKVLDFIAPIVLDSNLRVIDGNLRLEIAKINKKKKVPVIVINDSGKRADFLRMTLNRSSEFQRWIYPEIDEFVDTNPQVQPLAEPLGFFGKLLLPTSFFANTVVNYRLDEYNEQQKKYRQEMGIAAWAELMRERNEAEVEAKKPRKNKNPNAISLFDLAPKKDDFVPLHDIDKDIEAHQVEMRKVAETITDNYDEERKPKLMEQGKWQGTRRTSTEKSADLRREAEEAEELELTSIEAVETEPIEAVVVTEAVEQTKVNIPAKKVDEKLEIEAKAFQSEMDELTKAFEPIDESPKVEEPTEVTKETKTKPKATKPVKKKESTPKKTKAEPVKGKSLAELIAEQESAQLSVFDVFAPSESSEVTSIDDLF